MEDGLYLFPCEYFSNQVTVAAQRAWEMHSWRTGDGRSPFTEKPVGPVPR